MQYYGRVSQQTKLRSKLTGVGGQKGQLQWCPVGLCTQHTEYNTQHLYWRSSDSASAFLRLVNRASRSQYQTGELFG